MHHSAKSYFSRQLHLLYIGLAFLMVLATTGCASSYVDTALKDVPPEKMKKVQNPKPVQLLFEFQTRGASNARATDSLKTKVTELVKNSGLFSQVESAPVSNGAIISVIVNNVPLTDNAAAKGFATGLSFGLAGNTVTDGYICTVDYIADANTPKISKTVRHAIHTTVGNTSAPPNAVKSDSIQDAVSTMLRQIVTNGLNDVATDPSFK
jgi:hypothetical protein